MNSGEIHKFEDKKEWESFKQGFTKSYYEKLYADEPKSFPCIGIAVGESEGELGTNVHMVAFVYPNDFNT
jgi:hypothetical protein